MSSMDDLIAWLRVQLDEDERWAREASAYGDVWDEDTSGVLSQDMRNIAEARWRFVPHIARWDPARVLAEVDAKRRMIARLEAPLLYATDPNLGSLELIAWATGSLEVEAMPYADRPGYREEWRP